MSLSVDVFVYAEDGQLEVLDTPEGCQDLAGFESWRTTVWGSEVVRSLGARFFPLLAEGDLTVEPSQVPAFLRECALLRVSIEQIAAADPTKDRDRYREQISVRLANIQIAAGRAIGAGGGVLVW
ncbi:hypothetical protein [Flindersiella endophytica]